VLLALLVPQAQPVSMTKRRAKRRTPHSLADERRPQSASVRGSVAP
jgi:hypothetical protein